MNRKEYWQHIANKVLPTENKKKGRVPEVEVSFLFEKAVALIMTDEDEKAEEILRHTAYMLNTFYGFDRSYFNHLYSYFIKWLRSEPGINLQLNNIINAKWKEIQKDVLHFQLQDIYTSYIRCKPSGLLDDESEIFDNPIKGIPDTYCYEVLAAHLIEVARLHWLNDSFKNVYNCLLEAEKNLSTALSFVPKMMVEENTEWKKFAMLSDEEMKEKYPAESYYLEMRKQYRDSIPFYRHQVEILRQVNDFCRVRFIVKTDVIETLEYFIENFVGIGSNLSSPMTLPDELVWLMILQKFHKTEDEESRNIGEFLRKYLG